MNAIHGAKRRIALNRTPLAVDEQLGGPESKAPRVNLMRNVPPKSRRMSAIDRPGREKEALDE
jgi:hypothetical protein